MLIIFAMYILVGATLAYVVTTTTLLVERAKKKGKALDSTDRELLEGADEKHWVIKMYLYLMIFWLPVVLWGLYEKLLGGKRK
ncbi:hypothetical protein BSP36_041 [Bacillus phage BSP36]|nr:hypothetical protein BSP36_041 [Bacillus phage BSP36]